MFLTPALSPQSMPRHRIFFFSSGHEATDAQTGMRTPLLPQEMLFFVNMGPQIGVHPVVADTEWQDGDECRD